MMRSAGRSRGAPTWPLTMRGGHAEEDSAVSNASPARLACSSADRARASCFPACPSSHSTELISCQAGRGRVGPRPFEQLPRPALRPDLRPLVRAFYDPLGGTILINVDVRDRSGTSPRRSARSMRVGHDRPSTRRSSRSPTERSRGCGGGRSGGSFAPAGRGPPEQIGDGHHVVPTERSRTGLGEERRRPPTEFPSPVVERAERLPVPERLLEVVADDLVLLLGAIARTCVDPRGESPRAGRPGVPSGIASYAASRISRCRKRNASSPGTIERSVRTSSLRISERIRSGASSARETSGEQVAGRRPRGTPCRRRRRTRSSAARRRSGAPARAPSRAATGAAPRPTEIARRHPGAVPPDQQSVVDHHRRASARRTTGCRRRPRSRSRTPRPAVPRRRAGSRPGRPTASASAAAASTVVALNFPPPQFDRVSRNSGRAVHSSRIGASRDQSAT